MKRSCWMMFSLLALLTGCGSQESMWNERGLPTSNDRKVIGSNNYVLVSITIDRNPVLPGQSYIVSAEPGNFLPFEKLQATIQSSCADGSSYTRITWHGVADANGSFAFVQPSYCVGSDDIYVLQKLPRTDRLGNARESVM